MKTSFPLRRGLCIEIEGLPDDLTVHDVERVVRWLRTLPVPGCSVEVCACGSGAADPGERCPACGTPIPQREIAASEDLARAHQTLFGPFAPPPVFALATVAETKPDPEQLAEALRAGAGSRSSRKERA